MQLGLKIESSQKQVHLHYSIETQMHGSLISSCTTPETARQLLIGVTILEPSIKSQQGLVELRTTVTEHAPTSASLAMLVVIDSKGEDFNVLAIAVLNLAIISGLRHDASSVVGREACTIEADAFLLLVVVIHKQRKRSLHYDTIGWADLVFTLRSASNDKDTK